MFRGSAVRLALGAIALALAGNAAAAPHSCKFTRIAEWQVRAQGRQPVVDGAINGQKVGILLDTGASTSLILRRVAMKLGLTRQEAKGYSYFGVGGETQAEYTVVDELRIGDAVRRNWRALVAGEHALGDDVAALLGDDFFQQFDVEFDIAHKAVRLFQASGCDGVSLAYWSAEPAGEVAMEPGRKTLLTIKINGRPLPALLDSGASSSVLATPYASDLGVTSQSPGVIGGGCRAGLGGKELDSWIAPFQSFAIGHELIRNPRIHFGDLFKYTTYSQTGSRLQKPLEDLPGMLLGVDFLRAHRVLIANSQRKVYFTYAGGPVFPAVPSKSCSDRRAERAADPRSGED